MAVAAAGRTVTMDDASVTASLKIGAVSGVVAALVMAMYAMLAGATYLGSGFFTPLYHIASAFIEPKPMMTSMERAMSDQSSFYFTLGPAIIGMMVHLATGALFGMIFALLARSLRIGGAAAVLAGAAFGLLVMLFSSFVGLPIAASLFGGGDPISDMARVVGWPTFTIEHLVFGGITGLSWVLATRPSRETSVRASSAQHA